MFRSRSLPPSPVLRAIEDSENLYVTEVRLQCRFALSALRQALTAAGDAHRDDEVLWSSVQAMLAAVAIVSRLLVGDDIRGNQAAKQFGLDRGERLRQELATELNSPILDRRLRNHLEHVDQRLDDLVRDERTTVLIDRFVTTGVRPQLFYDQNRSAEAPLLREFAPEDGFVLFRDDEYNLFALRAELQRLESRANELLGEPRTAIAIRHRCISPVPSQE